MKPFGVCMRGRKAKWCLLYSKVRNVYKLDPAISHGGAMEAQI